MKLRLAVLSGTLCLTLMTSSCTRSTPASTSSSQAQPTTDLSQSSPAPTTDLSQSSPAPTVDEGAKAAQAPRPAPALKERAAAAPEPTIAPSAPEATMAPSEPEPTIAASATPAPPVQVILPAGTKLSVRINEAIGTKTSKPGDSFTGSITQPITGQGQTIIPAGSPVAGKVDSAEQGGKISGGSSLSLHLISVTVKAIEYRISTGQFQQDAQGKGSRTAKIGAGSGAAGALIGGLTGGGKGALIGTAVGAGAGVAGSALTGNKELSIPAETVLKFSLKQPLMVNVSASDNPNPANANATPQNQEDK